MTTENKILIAGIAAVALIGAGSLALAVYATMPMVLQVGANGGILLRGTVDAVNTNSLTVKSWGGDWVINVSSSTQLMPQNTMAQFNLGDFVGVRGIVNQNASWTVDAALVRNWTPGTVRNNPLSINYLQPSYGPVGTSIVINGSGFTQTGNRVKFGNLGSENNPSYSLNSSDGKTLVFPVPQGNYLSCWYSRPACMAAQYLTQPGNYNVSVINANGQSNEVSFT